MHPQQISGGLTSIAHAIAPLQPKISSLGRRVSIVYAICASTTANLIQCMPSTNTRASTAHTVLCLGQSVCWQALPQYPSSPHPIHFLSCTVPAASVHAGFRQADGEAMMMDYDYYRGTTSVGGPTTCPMWRWCYDDQKCRGAKAGQAGAAWSDVKSEGMWSG